MSDDRQVRLLLIITAAFEKQPLLDESMGAEFYPRMRAELLAAGATESDFEPLTEHLIHMVMEQPPFTREMVATQFKLIERDFLQRGFSVTVTNGRVESITFENKSGA